MLLLSLAISKMGWNNGDMTSLGHVRNRLRSKVICLLQQPSIAEITAPVWFARHILLKIFENFAAKMKVEIERFNNDILALVNPCKSIPSNCAACKKKFSAGSKPLQCDSCSLFFHTGYTIAKRRSPVFTCTV